MDFIGQRFSIIYGNEAELKVAAANPRGPVSATGGSEDQF